MSSVVISVVIEWCECIVSSCFVIQIVIVIVTVDITSVVDGQHLSGGARNNAKGT